ncbi:MAG TPA: porin family protein [Rhodobacteraceae bacterium]|nr:porin family protein [Paracoccaceae bacterium]
MKNLLATATAVLLVTSGSAALAGSVTPAPVDPIIPAPMPAPADDWTGFYFGGTVGWATGETVGVDDFEGVLYGGFAGYNYQFDNDMVLGVEAAASTGEREYDLGGAFDTTFIDLKARAGYAVDRALVYVSGGYTFANYDNAAEWEGGGFNVGAGVDFKVFDNAFIGAEYIYRDIEDTVADPAAWQDQFGTIQARVGITF